MWPSATALTGYGEKSYRLQRTQIRDASRRESEGCPTDFEIPLESPFAKVGTDEEVQQDVAGVWGVPRSLLSSPKSGGPKGVEARVRQYWNRLN
jgi:hypothetical protein